MALEQKRGSLGLAFALFCHRSLCPQSPILRRWSSPRAEHARSFSGPVKRVDLVLIAVLRCPSLSVVGLRVASTWFSGIHRCESILIADESCKLGSQIPRAQAFAIDYHLFSPVSRPFSSSPGFWRFDWLVGASWCCWPLWALSERGVTVLLVGCDGELLPCWRGRLCCSFVRGFGDLLLPSSVALEPSLGRSLAQLWQRSLRVGCARGGRVVPALVVLPVAGVRPSLARVCASCGCQRFELRRPCCAPVVGLSVSGFRPFAPLMCQLQPAWSRLICRRPSDSSGVLRLRFGCQRGCRRALYSSVWRSAYAVAHHRRMVGDATPSNLYSTNWRPTGAAILNLFEGS